MTTYLDIIAILEPCETDGWFTCGTGVCINSLLRCNEYKECWDGSDETGAVCQGTSVVHMCVFPNAKQLRFLC